MKNRRTRSYTQNHTLYIQSPFGFPLLLGGRPSFGAQEADFVPERFRSGVVCNRDRRIRVRSDSSMASGPFRGGQDMISRVFHVQRPRSWTSSLASAFRSSSAPLRCYRICFQTLSVGEVHLEVHLSKSIALLTSYLPSERCTVEVQSRGPCRRRGGADTGICTKKGHRRTSMTIKGRESGGLPSVAPGGSAKRGG